MIYSNCFVGAGISSITGATLLKDSVIVEKSKGIGGRIAARRLGPFSMDHGPLELEINQHIVDHPHAWIKEESRHLEILKEWEVDHFEIKNKMLELHSTDGKTLQAKRLIISAPAPQAKNILARSGMVTSFLGQIIYSSKIQLFILTQTPAAFNKLNVWFNLKQLKESPLGLTCLHFDLKQEFLSQFIDWEKEDIKFHFFQKIDKSLIVEGHIHKWRFSEVLNPIDPIHQLAFSEIGVFLIGDYFGSSGAASAIKSAEDILSELKA